jgi:hypothetical protein
MWDKCPECGNPDLDWDEVDIGVGVQKGNYGCRDCGWCESRYDDMDNFIEIRFAPRNEELTRE